MRDLQYRPRPSGPVSSVSLIETLYDPMQLNRRANLREAIEELRKLGTTSKSEQAVWLGLGSASVLSGLVYGDLIDDATAREIEWSMHKRAGWMDEDHRLDDLP